MDTQSPATGSLALVQGFGKHPLSRRFQRSRSKLPAECVRSLAGMCTELRVSCQFSSRHIAVEQTEAIKNRKVQLLFHMGEAAWKRNKVVPPR